jgi:putative membrane protein
MIAVPIFLWVIGDITFAPLMTIAALFQGLLVFAILMQAMGFYRALRILILVAVVTWLAEFIGSHTGFPFGDYYYTDRLQPQIAGVPLLIPVAWFMMLPPSWAIAHHITAPIASRWQRPAFILVSAFALTAWDLFLDPQMVARGFWVWEQPSGYFGIPWSNYAGWLLTAAIATWVACPTRLRKTGWLVAIYACVWFLQSVGQAIFWSQPGPAFFGSLAMGSLMILAYWRYRQANT